MKKTLILLGMLALTPQLKAQLLLEALDAPDKQKCTPLVNNFTPSDRCLELVCDKNYGDGDHNFIYCAVQGPNGKKWLNLNLGAEYAKESSPHFNPEAQPTGYDDWKAFGSLFQEGRSADGHELVKYLHKDVDPSFSHNDDYWYVERMKTPITESRVDPINSNSSVFVWGGDWMTDRNNIHNLWAGEMINNPCPNGYRIINATDIKSILVKDYTQVVSEPRNRYATTSMFLNNNYKNLILITAPIVKINDESSKGTLQRTWTQRSSVNRSGTSSLWLSNNMTGFWQYTKKIGFSRLIRGTGKNLHYYDVLDHGMNNNITYWLGLDVLGSMAVRCVEQ